MSARLEQYCVTIEGFGREPFCPLNEYGVRSVNEIAVGFRGRFLCGEHPGWMKWVMWIFKLFQARADFKLILKAVFLEAVETQLRENKPPETRQTFECLRSEGIREHDAKLLIGSVIAVETFEIMKTGTPFDKKRFVRNLNRLPDQPFDCDSLTRADDKQQDGVGPSACQRDRRK